MERPTWSFYLPAGLSPQELHQGQFVRLGGALGNHLAHPVQGSCGLDNISLVGRVWSLSQEAHGCRQVQAALDSAEGSKICESLAGELCGHILQACRSPHANHVLQKCISLLRPDTLQFVIEELQCSSVSKIARHKYGCRIIRDLVERCQMHQVHQIVESLIQEVGSLSRHPYGHHVVRSLLQHGTSEQHRCMVSALAGEVRLLCVDAYGCAVLKAALRYMPDAGRQALAQSLFQEPDIIADMAHTRHGHSTALRALELLDSRERAEVSWRLRSSGVCESHALAPTRRQKLFARCSKG
mmetsp:Transcript_75408/g.196061  ORF Transcript_75408/g.196061 Transcript_75408/m.196061 type:complete len:298 (-) Transcript_75408:435-1328(-)